MYSLAPNLDAGVASQNLDKLFTADINSILFQSAIRRLHSRFNIYAATCPAPFISPNLIVTPEIRRQSELYLPIAEISRIFNRLYRQALNYSPLFSSTPFYRVLSWADLFVALSPRLQFTVNPARLLEALLSDQGVLTEFLFVSFLPRRFYGGFLRYPTQIEFVREWLATISGSLRSREGNILRCLDAACGTGEASYGLGNLLMESGFVPSEVEIEGWTLEPLEVWAAAHLRFPHDLHRETTLRSVTSRLFESGYQASIRFHCADLTEINCLPLGKRGIEGEPGQFDIILCNGLLGGPIINKPNDLKMVVSTLASLVAPGGMLLAADSFHDGWKSKCGNNDLERLFRQMGLKCVDTGEGIAGLKGIDIRINRD
jgi:chemotaxis methyl-accepting protein methylase